MHLGERRKILNYATIPNSLDIGSVPGEIGILPEYREVTGTPKGLMGLLGP